MFPDIYFYICEKFKYSIHILELSIRISQNYHKFSKSMDANPATCRLRVRLRWDVPIHAVISLRALSCDRGGVLKRAVVSSITFPTLREDTQTWVRTVCPCWTRSPVIPCAFRTIETYRQTTDNILNMMLDLGKISQHVCVMSLSTVWCCLQFNWVRLRHRKYII